MNTTLDPSGCHPSFSCPQPQATTNVLRVSVMFPALDTSCERTHNTQRSVAGRFYIRFSGLMFSMCPHFIPLYYCVDGCALFCVSRQQLMDSWSVSVFCVMNDLSPGRSCRSCCVGVCFTSLRSTPKTEWLGCVVLLGFTVCELPHWFSEWLPHVRPAGCVWVFGFRHILAETSLSDYNGPSGCEVALTVGLICISLMTSDTVLICWGCCNKVSHVTWLKR